jgi:short-subunit dehydrogenase
MRLKPVSEQVMVITGASSGVGLVTARAAAARGARVVLAARNASDLARAVADIERDGGDATYVVADVADESQVDALAERALERYGRVDTWVNNAAVSMYGRIADLATADMRRQMDVNFWGTVYGSRAAVRCMGASGGAILNVASALADRAIPLQGVYCAAKHAMRAFSDALRMELEEAGVPVCVTLLKLGSVDTPFFQKARTLLGVEPRPVPPVYDPVVVARAILTCAEHRHREVTVSGMAKVISLAQKTSPRLTDLYMERTTFASQLTDEPAAAGRADNLYAPVAWDGGERGLTHRGRVKHSSAFTTLALRPPLALALAAGIVAAAMGLRRLARR